jgi:peptidoglycan/xylan/chitin deacetylase (PgdA/CDA1 family)
MKNTISFFVYYLFIAGFNCGYSQLELSFTAKYQGNYFPLDSIIIENINAGNKINKYYPDTLLQLIITELDDLNRPDESGFSLHQNCPNPFENRTNFDIYLPQNDLLIINIYNVLGKVLSNFERNMPAGNHSFIFTGSEEKIYFVTAKTRNYSADIKMVNLGGVKYDSGITLEYNGYDSGNDEYSRLNGKLKNSKNEFVYNQGDSLKIIGFITKDTIGVLSDTIIDIPEQSKNYTFQFDKINRIVILMYHRITDNEPGNEYERSLVDFENDLIYIRYNNYQVLSLEDLLHIQSGELKLISDGIIITFDDGFNSDYSKAVPLLSQYNMPGTFFIVPEWIDSLNYLTWSEVWGISEYLDKNGKKLFNIGSHTSSHPYLEQSSQYFTNQQDYLNFLYTELSDSKNWIVDITGRTDIFLSLPFGDGAYNKDIIHTAIYCGYKGIRTSIMNSFTVDEMDLYALPGIAILNNTSIDIIETYLNY